MAWIGLRGMIGTRRMRRRANLALVAPRSLLETADLDRACDALSALFGRDFAERPPVAFAQMRAMRRHDTTARLAKLAGTPALVVSALEDPIARPRAGRALADAIPGARYVEVSDASHAVVIHRAAEINALLRAYLDGVEDNKSLRSPPE